MNALVLAAGLGTRLLPLTEVMPKPLVPVCDRTLLGHQVDALRAAGVVNVLVNAHHLAEQVTAAAATEQVTRVFHEETILGTGGPLARLASAGYDDELVVVNGDVLHDVDLAAFAAAARLAAPFSLVLVDNPAVNTVGVDETGRVCAVKKFYEAGTPVRWGTFAGISWYGRDALARVRDDQFSIVSFWAAEAAAGRLPTAWWHGGDWFDVGTPTGLYAASYRRLAVLRQSCWGPTAPGMQGCINHRQTADSADLDHCIVMPEAQVPTGSWRRTIFLPGGAEPWQC